MERQPICRSEQCGVDIQHGEPEVQPEESLQDTKAREASAQVNAESPEGKRMPGSEIHRILYCSTSHRDDYYIDSFGNVYFSSRDAKIANADYHDK